MRSSSEGRDWLIATRRLLCANCPELLKHADHELAKILSHGIENALKEAMPVKWTHEIHEKLAPIYEEAQEFYRLLYEQPAMFIVVMQPAAIDGVSQSFDTEVMEAVNVPEDDVIDFTNTIELSLFPGVCKIGRKENVSVVDESNIFTLLLLT